MRNILAIFLSIILLTSCSKKEVNNRDNPLINDINTMAEFLFDIHLAEALEREKYIPSKKTNVLYTKIFEKHGVTTDQFDSAITYYTEHNRDYIMVYERVTNKINKYIKLADHNFFARYPAKNINIWKDYAIFPGGLYKFTQFLPYYICPKPEYLNKPLIFDK